ncbi:arginine--tRNA ligase, partial [Candidatus Peregrinibacteria bacterium]|nr:arginine--tRNA ligase [Candidatus Peregrinibacteria bacterium]
MEVAIKKLLAASIKKTFAVDFSDRIKIESPSEDIHGDYASNIALALSKELKKNPLEIAEKIVKNLGKSSLIGKVEIAGPGFINFFISEKELLKEVNKALIKNYGQSKVGAKKNIVMDYSSPNIAKPLGVHHLLSTIIGQALYNIHKNLGFKTISVNHIGDWGTQFGKLICAYKKWGNKKTLEKNPVNEMLKLYVKFHNEAEKHIELEDESRKEFKNFEEGDKENRKLWKWFVAESMKDINKTYKKLGGIHFDKIQGESFYEDKMGEILKEGKKLKIFVEGEDGAYVVKYSDPNIAPFVVQKKDGATLYSTRDFATLKYRVKTWHPAKLLYVVDVAQSMHFKQLFEGAKKFPWYKGEAEHVHFGRMRMKDAQMSTRKGNVILLDMLLEEAILRAKKIIENKNSKLKNKTRVAEVVGIGAVKYNILSQNRTTDIVFDWDKILSLEGNSGPYLQYSYARAKSILRKAGKIKSKKLTAQSGSLHPKEFSLIRLFPKFQERVEAAASEYKPNIICLY